MLKKTIKYEDYNGLERTEDFYFNLTQPEVIEMEKSIEGGLVKKIERIAAAQDENEILRLFKEIIFKSYGEKSDDGRRFIKSDALSVAFSQTEAYTKLFMEIMTSPGAAEAFINGIVPQEKK